MGGGILRFLVVEDDPSSNRLFQIYLSELGACSMAMDGLEAINLFQEALRDGRPFDAVLLDVLMPNVDGLVVLEEIRRMEIQWGRSPVPVVLMSALGEYEVLGQVNDPLVVVVRKPVSRLALRKALEQALTLPGPKGGGE